MKCVICIFRGMFLQLEYFQRQERPRLNEQKRLGSQSFYKAKRLISVFEMVLHGLRKAQLLQRSWTSKWALPHVAIDSLLDSRIGSILSIGWTFRREIFCKSSKDTRLQSLPLHFATKILGLGIKKSWLQVPGIRYAKCMISITASFESPALSRPSSCGIPMWTTLSNWSYRPVDWRPISEQKLDLVDCCTRGLFEGTLCLSFPRLVGFRELR